MLSNGSSRSSKTTLFEDSTILEVSCAKRGPGKCAYAHSDGPIPRRYCSASSIIADCNVTDGKDRVSAQLRHTSRFWYSRGVMQAQRTEVILPALTSMETTTLYNVGTLTSRQNQPNTFTPSCQDDPLSLTPHMGSISSRWGYEPLSSTYTHAKTALAAKVKIGMPSTTGTNLQKIRNSESGHCMYVLNPADLCYPEPPPHVVARAASRASLLTPARSPLSLGFLIS